MVNLKYSLNTLVTKIRVWYSRRIRKARYEDLISCKTVESFFSVLCENEFYSKKIQNLSGNLSKCAFNSSVLVEIFMSIVKDIGKYEKILGGVLHNYIKTFLDIRFINSILDKTLLSGDTFYDFSMKIPQNNGSYCYTKNLMHLNDVSNLHDFFNILNETRFSKICRKIDLSKDKLHIINSLQKKLYEEIYNSLFSTLNDISDRTSKKNLYNIFTCYLELKNFAFAIRSKKIKTCDESSLPKFKYVKQTLVKEIEKISVESDFFKLLDNYRAKKNIEKGSFVYAEQIADQFLLKKCKEVIKFSTNADAVVLSYINILRIEIDNLVKIIESINFNLPKNKIFELLVI